jgi:predicted transcriptional regulator
MVSMAQDTKNMTFDMHLLKRLSVIADKRGVPVEELVSLALSDFVTAEEHGAIERVALEHRWQNYLDTGKTVPADKVRAKLRDYAAEAGRRMEM